MYARIMVYVYHLCSVSAVLLLSIKYSAIHSMTGASALVYCVSNCDPQFEFEPLGQISKLISHGNLQMRP